MNARLIALLQKTPGLILGSREFVSQQDYRETLTISRPTDIFDGSWVEITQGIHQGDVGLVVEKRIDGAEVVLIPRLPPPAHFIRPGKRKSSTITYPPALFAPEIFQAQLPNQVSLRSVGVYQFRKRLFENGLERRLFKKTFLKHDPDSIPYDICNTLIGTGHPRIKKSFIPRPREWLFEEDERITVESKGCRGILTKITPCHAVVELIHDEDKWVTEHCDIPWQDIRKDIAIGDYVKIRTGSESGHIGWVTKIAGVNVTIVSVQVNGTVLEPIQSHEITKVCQRRSPI